MFVKGLLPFKQFNICISSTSGNILLSVFQRISTPPNDRFVYKRLKKLKSFSNIATLNNENLHDKLRNLKSTEVNEYWNMINPKNI